MPLIVDFLLPRRPVSHQNGDAQKKAGWRNYVFGRAMQAWPTTPLLNTSLKFTMVYLADHTNPGDINNFVKPIQDALCGLIYADDAMIFDVSAHMRMQGSVKRTPGLPDELVRGLMSNMCCVYVAISDSTDLAKELRWT